MIEGFPCIRMGMCIYVPCSPLSIIVAHTQKQSTHIEYTQQVHEFKNEVGCRDDTVPKTVERRRHCEEE